MRDNLTQYEHDALNRVFNLADGHAHQGQNIGQAEIIARLTEIFHAAEGSPQEIAEQRFLDAFFTLAGQSGHSSGGRHASLICYSASGAIEMVAAFLRESRARTALIEPTFDNLHSMLRRHAVEVMPLNEADLLSDAADEALRAVDADAIFLVQPNNPTGRYLTTGEFKRVVDFCRATGKFLIVDFSFRFFVEGLFWDQYQMALQSGVDFLFVEDTGKTWPSLDLKVGILTVAPRIYPAVYSIHNDALLNVSPFILELLRQYIEESARVGLGPGIRDVVADNRRTFRHLVPSTILRSLNPDSQISVEWLEIVSGRGADELWQYLRDRGVYVLPGTHFYWSRHDEGQRFLRVALMRDRDVFSEAVRVLCEALGSLNVHSFSATASVEGG